MVRPSSPKAIGREPPSSRFIIITQQEDPARTDRDLITLVDAGGRHLGAVDHDKLGIGRSLDPKSPLLPAYPAVHRPDSFAVQEHVAGSARPEQDGMIARQLDELDTALTVVYFQGGHAILSVVRCGPASTQCG